MNKPPILILSWPSASGKTVINQKIEEIHCAPTGKIITCTTRPPRAWEVQAKDYYFYTKEEFEEMIQRGECIEWAKYPKPKNATDENWNFYGSTWQELERITSQKLVPIYIIEVQWAKTITEILQEKYRVISLFLLPPSEEELERRLRGRGTEPEDVIQKRLAAAKDEIALKDNYDVRLVNHDILETATTIGRLVGDLLANAPDSYIKKYDMVA